MVLKLIPISTVLIGRFQHHKALDEYNNCNFQFYSVYAKNLPFKSQRWKIPADG